MVVSVVAATLWRAGEGSGFVASTAGQRLCRFGEEYSDSAVACELRRRVCLQLQRRLLEAASVVSIVAMLRDLSST